MQKKSLKQKMIEKLYEEHGIFLDPCDLVSYRRNGFGSEIVSWSTIKSKPMYQSFNTMRDCYKYPTKLVQRGLPPHVDPEITIEIDFDKIAHLLTPRARRRRESYRQKRVILCKHSPLFHPFLVPPFAGNPSRWADCSTER